AKACCFNTSSYPLRSSPCRSAGRSLCSSAVPKPTRACPMRNAEAWAHSGTPRSVQRRYATIRLSRRRWRTGIDLGSGCVRRTESYEAYASSPCWKRTSARSGGEASLGWACARRRYSARYDEAGGRRRARVRRIRGREDRVRLARLRRLLGLFPRLGDLQMRVLHVLALGEAPDQCLHRGHALARLAGARVREPGAVLRQVRIGVAR